MSKRRERLKRDAEALGYYVSHDSRGNTTIRGVLKGVRISPNGSAWDLMVPPSEAKAMSFAEVERHLGLQRERGQPGPELLAKRFPMR